MKKLLITAAFLGVAAVSAVASQDVQLFVTSLGKTVKVEEISFPEEITMHVGDAQFAPITMTTKDGEVAESDLEKICKQYKMVWVTSNPEIVLANRKGELIAKNPGEVELKAASYNTMDMDAKMTIIVEP